MRSGWSGERAEKLRRSRPVSGGTRTVGPKGRGRSSARISSIRTVGGAALKGNAPASTDTAPAIVPNHSRPSAPAKPAGLPKLASATPRSVPRTTASSARARPSATASSSALATTAIPRFVEIHIRPRPSSRIRETALSGRPWSAVKRTTRPARSRPTPPP